MSWLARFRSHLPSRAQLAGNRWLRWLAPFLDRPQLWRWTRRGVALGVALGVFFGFLVPVAQIPLAAAAAVILRANVPAAAASTLVSNPVTYAPIYYTAYSLGTWLTGEQAAAPPPATTEPSAGGAPGVWQRIAGIGLPLLVGLVTIATLAGLLSYGLISLVWYWHVRRRRCRLP
jgi:hypothetical protein